MSEWQRVDSGVRPASWAEHPEPVLVVERDGRRYIGRWDADSGYFFGEMIMDGNPPAHEWPRRLYGATHWQPLPAPPSA